jgi:hypothetical protein
LFWKEDIHTFPTIYYKPANSSGRKRKMYLKSELESIKECTKITETLFPCVLCIPVNTRIH